MALQSPNFSKRISFYKKPSLGDWRLQLCILFLIIPFFLEILVNRPTDLQSPVPEFTLTSLFAIPILYAAFNLGLLATLGVAAVGVILVQVDIIRNIRFGYSVGIWADYIQIVIIVVTSAVVAHYVEVYKHARLESEKALEQHRLAETKYRSLFLTTATPIAIIDRGGIIREINSAFLQSFAKQEVQVIGLPIDQVLSQPILALTSSEIHESTTLVEFQDNIFRAEVTFIRANTELEPLIQIIFHDVSEEERRSTASKLFSNYVIQGQEDERRRIAQELHDDPLQRLVHLCRVIDQADAIARRSNLEISALPEARLLAEQVADNIRSISANLLPPTISDLGLQAALFNLVEEFQKMKEFEITLDVAGDERDFDGNVELSLYRIAQEAINNAIHHSNCNKIMVELKYRGPTITLTICDDGVGISEILGDQSDRVHLGLIGMKERAESIGGKLTIAPIQPQGTVVEVTVSDID